MFGKGIFGLGITLLVVAWVLLGIAAFIHSILCAVKTPSILKGALGITLAILFGPLYFVYPLADKSFCKNPENLEHRL